MLEFKWKELLCGNGSQYLDFWLDATALGLLLNLGKISQHRSGLSF